MSRITADQGWNHLTKILGKQAPKRLTYTGDVRRSLRKLTQGKGRR